jgi:flagellar hook protein FlgE
MSIYDSLGTEQTVDVIWTKTANPNEWKVSVLSPNGVITRDVGGTQTDFIDHTGTGGTDNRMVVSFNNDGTPNTFDGAATTSPITIAWNVASGAQAANSTINLNLGSQNMTDGVIFNGSQFYVTVTNQDGKPTGIPSGVQIDADGIVSFVFSNGERLKRYKIPLANFPNVNGLDEKSGNMYTQTTGSGAPILNAPKTGGVGSIIAGKLEGSNVNTPQEFTKLIQYQQAYSANLNVIQAAKKMSEQLDGVMMR